MLFEKLRDNASSDFLPMHMPGHKRNTQLLGKELPYELDITEISGFDDLHEMRGVLRTLAEMATSLYGADSAFPMVNGSTGGILAAVRAAACRGSGGSIIMSRFSHKSVYNAAELCSLAPVYLLPECCGACISAADVENAIKTTGDALCVVLTSPTYEGAVCDVAAIAEITHAHGVPLIIDAAHGAHFGFSEFFPQNATRLGADVEIVSLHKTLPALTQSALLLARRGGLVPPKELERQLRVFETSSPSYMLLASIDRCLRLLCDTGEELFRVYEENLLYFYEKIRVLKRLEVAKMTGYDIGKIIINTKKSNITGKNLQSLLLEEHKIELEMAMPDYALAMTSICDTRDSFERLAAALLSIDTQLKPGERQSIEPYMLPKRELAPFDARGKNGWPVMLSRALGKVALEYVWAYPPGVPLLVPGEIVDEALLRHINGLQDAELSLRSDYGRLPEIMCAAE